MTWYALVPLLTGAAICWCLRDANRAANRAEKAARRAEAAARAVKRPDVVDEYTDPSIIGDTP